MPLKTAKSSSILSSIHDLWSLYPSVIELCNNITDETTTYNAVTGLVGSSGSFLIRAISQNTAKPILIITKDTPSANDMYDDLSGLIGSDVVGYFPARQILPYDFKAPQGEIMGQRISTLAGLLDKSISVVVCSIRSLIEPTITKEHLSSNRIYLESGKEIDLDDLVEQLINMGFRRVPIVEEVGDFAVRGGLIDFFSPGSEAPVRVEFFGDEVDTIRLFNVADQRTLKKIDKISLLPKREIPITQESLEKYLNNISENDADYIRSCYLNDPELPGLEWLSILFGISQGSLIDYIDEKSIIFYDNEEVIEEEAESIINEGMALYARLKDRMDKLPPPELYYQDPEKIFQKLNDKHVVDIVPFRGGKSGIIDFNCKPHPSFGSRLDLLTDTTGEFSKIGITYFIATDTEPQVSRLGELISERVGEEFKLNIEVANLKGGFICQSGRFAILTDHEIFSRYHRRTRKKKFKEGVAISDYSSLTRGDFVVHTEHGIAKYLGLETIVVDERHRDCLLLEYAEKDRLYVPIEEFNRVSKYSGKDSDPVLTHLGGAGWEKLKKKTKKAVVDMAEDLLKLYAQRKSKSGFAFGEDTVWLKQLEASFPFQETPDQEKAIIDVKGDMKTDQPMDRLVCGDVGYGKTEVAIRAAFKAIEGGKQVAVLVPTTILAQQHYQTFSERMIKVPL